ncbi:U6 snRNA-associated Sm-like protein LSm8 [Meyerozyma sp. JA9]|nr:U6 snRNA-associated Sm-like protein LSm8 [Meyerozyma sp. JA9]
MLPSAPQLYTNAEPVRVITTDARLFEGILEGFDNSTNIILSSCYEHIIYEDEKEENQSIPLGVYFMRGGNVVCIGETSGEVDFSKMKRTLKGTKNPL